jgi:hypothetical protein
MPWYVYALVDVPPAGPTGSGLSGPLAVRRVPGAFAIVERRADVPPVEFGTLRAHDAVVTRLAEGAPAILPVRFGTLLELEELEDALADRDEEIAEAFERVRGRVQFTWRRPNAGAQRQRSGVRSLESGVRNEKPGTAYLRSAAHAATATPPAAFRALTETLRPLIAGERYQAATTSLPDSVYHLVDRRGIDRYRLLASELAAATPILRITGPFPPFAFAPEVL